VTRAWAMPEELVTVASSHHHPKTKWAAAIRVAERVAHEQGFGVGLPGGSPETVDDEELRHACELLSMTEPALDRFRESAAQLL